MSERGTNCLIADNDGDTINNIRAFVAQMAISLENDPDQLGLLLSLQAVHNALGNLAKSQKDKLS